MYINVYARLQLYYTHTHTHAYVYETGNLTKCIASHASWKMWFHIDFKFGLSSLSKTKRNICIHTGRPRIDDCVWVVLFFLDTCVYVHRVCGLRNDLLPYEKMNFFLFFSALTNIIIFDAHRSANAWNVEKVITTAPGLTITECV